MNKISLINVALLLTIGLILFITNNAQAGSVLTLVGTVGLLLLYTKRENYSLQDCSAYPFDFNKE